MYIEKEFKFEAAHFLKKEGCDYGKCGNVHGHSYILKVRLFGEPRRDGMIMNFTDLKKIVNDHIVERMDHSLLNESFPKFLFDYDLAPGIETTIISTCENMSYYFAQFLANYIREKTYYNDVTKIGITLYETATSHCYCECEVDCNE